MSHASSVYPRCAEQEWNPLAKLTQTNPRLAAKLLEAAVSGWAPRSMLERDARKELRKVAVRVRRIADAQVSAK